MSAYSELPVQEQYALNAYIFNIEISKLHYPDSSPMALKDIDEKREQLAPNWSNSGLSNSALKVLGNVISGLQMDSAKADGKEDFAPATTLSRTHYGIRELAKKKGLDLDSWLEMLDIKSLVEDRGEYLDTNRILAAVMHKASFTDLPDGKVFSGLEKYKLGSYSRPLGTNKR